MPACMICPSSLSARTISPGPSRSKSQVSRPKSRISASRPSPTDFPASLSTATTSSPSTASLRKPSPAPAAVTAPTLIECKTYRWYGRFGNRSGQVSRRSGRGRTLEGQRIPSPAWKSIPHQQGPLHARPGSRRGLLDAFNKELEAAIEIADKSPMPEGVEALDHVFSFDIRERFAESQGIRAKV